MGRRGGNSTGSGVREPRESRRAGTRRHGLVWRRSVEDRCVRISIRRRSDRYSKSRPAESCVARQAFDPPRTFIDHLVDRRPACEIDVLRVDPAPVTLEAARSRESPAAERNLLLVIIYLIGGIILATILEKSGFSSLEMSGFGHRVGPGGRHGEMGTPLPGPAWLWIRCYGRPRSRSSASSDSICGAGRWSGNSDSRR